MIVREAQDTRLQFLSTTEKEQFKRTSPRRRRTRKAEGGEGEPGIKWATSTVSGTLSTPPVLLLLLLVSCFKLGPETCSIPPQGKKNPSVFAQLRQLGASANSETPGRLCPLPRHLVSPRQKSLKGMNMIKSCNVGRRRRAT